MGEEQAFLPPMHDNPEGCFESHGAVSLRERFMGTLSMRWNTPRLLGPGWTNWSRIQPFKQQLKELIESAFGSRALWGWKDPRTCLFFPLWKDVLEDLGIKVSVVFVVRNPLEVSESLRARDDMSLEAAEALWSHYVGAGLGAIGETPHVFLSFNQMLDSPVTQIAHVKRMLGLAPNDPEQDEQVRGAVKLDLRHHTATLTPEKATFGTYQALELRATP